jgi:hypothetical protein
MKTTAPRLVGARVIQGLFNPGETGLFWELVMLLKLKAEGKGRT